MDFNTDIRVSKYFKENPILNSQSHFWKSPPFSSPLFSSPQTILSVPQAWPPSLASLSRGAELMDPASPAASSLLLISPTDIPIPQGKKEDLEADRPGGILSC